MLKTVRNILFWLIAISVASNQIGYCFENKKDSFIYRKVSVYKTYQDLGTKNGVEKCEVWVFGFPKGDFEPDFITGSLEGCAVYGGWPSGTTFICISPEKVKNCIDILLPQKNTNKI